MNINEGNFFELKMFQGYPNAHALCTIDKPLHSWKLIRVVSKMKLDMNKFISNKNCMIRYDVNPTIYNVKFSF